MVCFTSIRHLLTIGCKNIQLDEDTKIALPCYIVTVFFFFLFACFTQTYHNLSDSHEDIHIPVLVPVLLWIIVMFMILSPLFMILWKRYKICEGGLINIHNESRSKKGYHTVPLEEENAMLSNDSRDSGGIFTLEDDDEDVDNV